MKFVDQATIWVISGKGGPGCSSFRREKYVERGGPDGGDGGKGGDVVLEANSQKDTLFRFHMNQHFKAGNGRPGEGRNRHGKYGDDRIVMVPAGTVIFDVETDELIVDLAKPGDQYVIAEGGRGGRGNARFVTSTNRAPRHCQPGEPGQELRIRLELKLLADVGLIGLPNAGKSTLISRLSAARPKIADYPFTTLIPNLGVVRVGEYDSFVVADIPGLIEGASQGAGLGHRFLRHIQRCRVLVHLLDSSDIDPDDPLASYHTLLAELEAFDQGLTAKEQMVAVTKTDLTGSEESLQAVKNALPDQKVFAISAVTGQGLDDLKYAIWDILKEFAESDEVESDSNTAKEPENGDQENGGGA